MLSLFLITGCLSYPGVAFHDWKENEGRFSNASDKALYCYSDRGDSHICKVKTEPGDSCKGDAMGNNSMVFKIPNRAHFICDEHIECTGADMESSLMLLGAALKNGPFLYGQMDMEYFHKIMGEMPIVDCEK